MERIDAAFKKALDALYSRMGLAKEQVRNIRVKDRLERLATDKDGSRQVEREMRQLQQKLKEKESELFKMENNISFFSSSKKGTNPLLDAAQKNIENLKVEVEELRGKLKIFRQYA
jgi:chromosome segregation ATPase